jgi:hypothetical protein
MRYRALVYLLFSIIFIVSCSEDATGPEEPGPSGPSFCEMQRLPSPEGNIVTVSDAGELTSAVSTANSTGGNITILLENGTYQINSPLFVDANNVTFRSVSEDRDSVTVRGNGISIEPNTVFLIYGSGCTIADLTAGWVNGNAVRIGPDMDDCLLHNLRLVDTGEQMVVVESDAWSGPLSERGIMRWCLLEYTAGLGPGEYIGGIMAHQSTDWHVHHNSIRGINNPHGPVAGPAILFWNDSANTLIEHNVIYNCDRGIFLGLGMEQSHIGGMVRNNMVHTVRAAGIVLHSTPSASLYNNTVYTVNYSASIEYRFPATQNVSIINNLTNKVISELTGATGVLETNFTSAEQSWFVDAIAGNLRLVASRPEAVNQGTELSSVTIDMDCDKRPKRGSTDIGADEF